MMRSRFGLVLIGMFLGRSELENLGRGLDSPGKLQFLVIRNLGIWGTQSLGAGSVFLCMGFPLGRVMPRGGVRHRFWENVTGLAELFGVWVHGPMPQGSCMDDFSHVG